ncbi:MAG: SGNH/GDSL hydrolase family protein [Alphaproteobacteria bacterium]|nr:SGNH/GDSL hydrolase family protein [Alphaproteobacteria bacterium]
MLALPLAVLELFSQALYYWKYGEPPWAAEVQERFNFRPFTRLVSDRRNMTMLSNADISFGSWNVLTDEHGFRISAGARNSVKKGPSILFLGDSVPFGWGLDAEYSTPAQLERFLAEAGRAQPILNAAIPSYSLHQAIERYLLEIAGRHPIEVIVLWSYDPVTQLALLGNQWTPDINWTTQSPAIARANEFQIEERSYSAAVAILRKFAARLIEGTAILEHFDPADAPTAKRFQSDISARLDSFHAVIKGQGVRRLILLPLSAPRSSREGFSPARRAAVALFNQTLSRFARQHDDVHFIDVQALLDAHPEDKVFLDQCCHLTEMGSALVAMALKKDLLSEP